MKKLIGALLCSAIVSGSVFATDATRLTASVDASGKSIYLVSIENVDYACTPRSTSTDVVSVGQKFGAGAANKSGANLVVLHCVKQRTD